MQDNFLKDQVLSMRKSGASTVQIATKLRSAGWSEKIIESALSQQPNGGNIAAPACIVDKRRRKFKAYATVLGLSLAVLFSSNISPVSGRPDQFILGVLSGIQQMGAGDFHTYEELGNGYALVTSVPHKYSFEVPSNLRFYAPTGESRPDSNFSFQSKNRGIDGVFLYTISAEIANDTCDRFSNVNPNWQPTTVNSYSAVKSTASRIGQTTIICTATQDVTFSYKYDYSTRNGQVAVKEKVAAEQVGYDHMVKSFKLKE